MRFLEVDDGDGESFRLTKDFHENDIPRRYAILSHTWGEDGDEVTFQDMQNGSGVGKPGFEKIRFCARQARCDGIKYFWIDTCCINKNDSFELSRAINSMFRWYKRAAKCYVYLSDVPRESKERVRESRDWTSDFCRSRWFGRGWTLQELLAPDTVEFFSRYGLKLGNKTSLEGQIRDITKIPVAALRGDALSNFTKEERFSWQKDRQTYEEEDIIYSLLGIFDVSIPVIYGEGRRHARSRLDREIDRAMKGSDYESFSIRFAILELVQIPHFVAREDELRDIHQALRSDGARRSVTLHGLGGIGKTQLALAYATRYRDDYSAVFWIRAQDEGSIKLSFANIAKRIAYAHPSVTAMRNADNSSDLDQAVAAVKEWLSLANNTRWLIIYDNYDNPKIPGNSDPSALDLRKFVPESHQGCLIVTTRSSQVCFGQRMRIRKLETIEDSLAILSHYSDRSALLNDPDAVELAKKLDGLPLALATAGAYLRETGITLADYCELYEASWAQLQKTSPYLDSYKDRQQHSTWQISFDQIQQRNLASAELLRLWAYFDNEDIWFELLSCEDRKLPAWLCKLSKDKLEFHSTIRVLCDHGMAEVNDTNRGQLLGYSMPSEIHTWARNMLAAEPDELLARTALICVASSVPSNETESWWLVQQRLFKHANRLLVGHASAGRAVSQAYHKLGQLYRDQDKLVEAQQMYQRALEGKEMLLGSHHKRTLITVESLGNLYRAQGKLSEAEGMYQRALEGFEKARGPDHWSTLTTVQNLGNVYAESGKLSQAEGMYQRALQGLERKHGPYHTSTLSIVHNLGHIHRARGKLTQAEEMYQRALEGFERERGPYHTSTLDIVLSLGNNYKDQSKLSDAEQMYQRALQGFEGTVGPDHTSTLRALFDLGALYCQEGKLVEAEEMLRRSLQGHEKALGQNHTSTLEVVYNVGLVLIRQSRLIEAEVLYKRLVSSQENLLLSNHGRLETFGEKLRQLKAETCASRGAQASDRSRHGEPELSSEGQHEDL